MTEIKEVKTEDELNECLNVRRKSFIEEENVPEEIEIDGSDVLGGPCRHFMICSDGQVIGTFRLTAQVKEAHLQRFCVYKEQRSKGFGSVAFAFLDEYCAENGIQKLYFDAQLKAVTFYKRNGCRVVSEEFEEAGIPHVKMEKVYYELI